MGAQVSCVTGLAQWMYTNEPTRIRARAELAERIVEAVRACDNGPEVDAEGESIPHGGFDAAGAIRAVLAILESEVFDPA